MRTFSQIRNIVFLVMPMNVALAANLTNVEFSAMAGNKTEIRLSFDGSVGDPKTYALEQPARISIDLPGTTSQVQKYFQIGSGNARSATVLNAGGKTRMVLNLTKLVPYSMTRSGNQLVVMLGQKSGDAVELAELVADTPKKATKEVTLIGDPNTSGKKATGITAKAVKSVDFRRGENGEGQVILRFSDSSASADVHEEGGKIAVQIPNFDLPKRLQRRLDVVDFATAVKFVDAYKKGSDTYLMIEPDGEFEYMAYQTDRTMTIDIKKVTQEEQEARKQSKFPYDGDKLSLNFQDIPVRSVLQLIADFTGLNLVASDTIQGNITLRLKNVPWDQALDLVLKTKGLDKREVGNVLLVGPADEIAAREKQELETQAQIEKLAPLSTEFIQINYAKAADIVKLIHEQASGSSSEIPAAGADALSTVAAASASSSSSSTTGGRLLSARGSIAVDERTNKIMVRDTASNLERIRQAVAEFDVPIRQVLIEARIVVASSTVGKELGVRWGGGGDSYSTGDSSYVSASGSLDSNTEIHNYVAGVEDETYFSYPNALAVNLPATSSEASSFAIGFTALDYALDLELSALESSGNAEIISQPKIMTADGRESTILSGTEIPYTTDEDIEFREAVLSLKVLPQITPDDRFVIDLEITQDQVGEILSNAITIDRNLLNTQVLVDNGQTIVLGGIFQSSNVQSVYKTPFFGDLPLIGALFRRTTNSEEKNELLIFITPKLVDNQLTSR